MKRYFTVESVTEGHPDKLCDYISDSILDAYLKKDSLSRVGCEVVAGKNTIFVTGEVTSKATIDIEKEVRKAIKEIGYFGDTDIDYKKCEVIINISKQSPDIALGTNDEVGGAGDQGIMFGYATDETKSYLPLGLVIAHSLAKRLTEVRKKDIIKNLGPDGKTEVTIEYDNDKPIRVDTILISTQTSEDKDLETLKQEIKTEVIDKVISKELIDKETKILVNPTGKFVIGGPHGDTGLTGRKIIVDTYGGKGAHGGGAFSGKDPSKVDRSAAYAARYIAKNMVAAGVADEMLVQLAYAIGVAEPVSVFVDTYGRSNVKMSNGEIAEWIKSHFDLRPKAIERTLKLRQPIYLETAAYGHMGRKNEVVAKTFTSRYHETKVMNVELFTWEKLDKVNEIKEAFAL